MLSSSSFLLWQVMDVVDRLFVAMFDSLNKNCAKDLEAVGRQYPFQPLKVFEPQQAYHLVNSYIVPA